MTGDNNQGRHPKILDWSDEREGMGRDGDPIMVTLVKGFAYQDNDVDDMALHVRGFYTVKEAMKEVRAAKPCKCSRCRGEQ